MFEWNPVFNFVIDIKNKYFTKYGMIDYDKHIVEDEESNIKEITCLEYWIENLNDQDKKSAKEKIKYLEINQDEELVLLRYGKYSSVELNSEDLTFSDLWNLYDGFLLECRSVVIDLKNEEIVIAPFRKFRNLNECPENELSVVMEEIKNAKTIEITNKLDGSMQCLRWYNGKIFMSGSQAINPDMSWRLADGLERLTNNYKVMAKENSNLTFIFEYIALKDAHVVKYSAEEEGLYLIGIRDVYTGKQYSYKEISEFAKKYEIPMTKIFDKTFEDILKDIKKIKSDEMEGFVVNIDGHMIKVKGDDYVQIHKILSKISSINLIIKSIAENTIDDLYSKIPTAYKGRVKAVSNVVYTYIHNMEEKVNEYYSKAPKATRKDFMIWVEENVPKQYKSYVKSKFLGVEYNYVKYGNNKNPSYKKLNEMGIVDYKKFFEEACCD